jgi:hypothetical protein
MSEIPLFALNPALDRAGAASRFDREGRVQLRDFLALPAAQTIHRVLSQETPWGLAWQAGEDGPHGLRQQHVAAQPLAETQEISSRVATAVRAGDYAFAYAQYQIVTAALEGWHEHPALDLLLEHINSEPMLDLVRAVSGMPGLVKADAQATLYGPHHFLAMHDDSVVEEGRQVAYVMNFSAEDWRPDWGGYLLFYDEEGDVVAGFRPRFNTLNMFRIPQRHNVSYVPPFAPIGRFAITGWFRDR